MRKIDQDMKLGDRIVCINDRATDPFYDSFRKPALTFGKMYKIKNLSYDYQYCNVINDLGEVTSYNIQRFVNLIKHRKQKLNKILCD